MNAAESRTFFEHCSNLVEVMKKEGGKSEPLQLVELKKEPVALPETPEITKLER